MLCFFPFFLFGVFLYLCYFPYRSCSRCHSVRLALITWSGQAPDLALLGQHPILSWFVAGPLAPYLSRLVADQLEPDSSDSELCGHAAHF